MKKRVIIKLDEEVYHKLKVLEDVYGGVSNSNILTMLICHQFECEDLRRRLTDPRIIPASDDFMNLPE